MQLFSRKTKNFLSQYDMQPDRIDLYADYKMFVSEMQNGLTDHAGSLKMLCTYIRTDRDIPTGEPVIVIDAGGTNFRVAVVTFDGVNNPLVEDMATYPMPGTTGEISRNEFYALIVSYLAPVIHRSNKIGFCFSFPTSITPERDGLLISFCKEVNVRDMNNELIGASLNQALKESGVAREKSIILLNDTVATLLGGKAACPNRVFDSFAGLILGTGLNTCYIENNANILKYPDVAGQPGSTIINIESGGYDRFAGGEFDRRLDNMTSDPGRQKFEKMVSGVYIGRIILEVLHQAAADGLFSDSCKERIDRLQDLTAKEVDDFCYFPYDHSNPLGECVKGNADFSIVRDMQMNTGFAFSEGNSQPEDDRQMIYYLIDAVFERAARMVAVNLAAVIHQSGKGTNPCAPVLITAEGTTFYKAKLFRCKLDYYVRTFLNDQLGLFCEFIKVDNSTIIGAAIAGLWG